jgi:hypothetical protein
MLTEALALDRESSLVYYVYMIAELHIGNRRHRRHHLHGFTSLNFPPFYSIFSAATSHDVG